MAPTKDQIGQRIKRDLSSRPPLMNKNLILRVPDELHAKLTSVAQEMSAEMPGHRVTISDVARSILEFGLKDRKGKQGGI